MTKEEADKMIAADLAVLGPDWEITRDFNPSYTLKKGNWITYVYIADPIIHYSMEYWEMDISDECPFICGFGNSLSECLASFQESLDLLLKSLQAVSEEPCFKSLKP